MQLMYQCIWLFTTQRDIFYFFKYKSNTCSRNFGKCRNYQEANNKVIIISSPRGSHCQHGKKFLFSFFHKPFHIVKIIVEIPFHVLLYSLRVLY